MHNKRFFEFEDLAWFPNAIRQGGTDYLRYFMNLSGFYDDAVPLIARLLEKAGETKILDLCSGGGGGIERTTKKLLKWSGLNLSITLSDKFPNLSAFKHISRTTGNVIDYIAEPVDALQIPQHLPGMLTMFTALHHFNEEEIKKILSQATKQKRSIAFFDGADKHIGSALAILLFQPISFVAATPFIRPFTWKRILFTYVLPAIPIMTMWDGLISVSRLHHWKTLKKIAEETEPAYHWQVGLLRNKLGMGVTYLTGYPH